MTVAIFFLIIIVIIIIIFSLSETGNLGTHNENDKQDKDEHKIEDVILTDADGNEAVVPLDDGFDFVDKSGDGILQRSEVIAYRDGINIKWLQDQYENHNDGSSPDNNIYDRDYVRNRTHKSLVDLKTFFLPVSVWPKCQKKDKKKKRCKGKYFGADTVSEKHNSGNFGV